MLTGTFAIGLDAARSGLRIIASPIDDGGRMSVPMMALDGHRPHAGDGGDRSAGDVARDAWIEDTENRWRQGDVAPVIRSSERPVRGGGRSDPPRWGRPDEPPLDPDAQSERRKHAARSPEEVERIRDDAWERMRVGSGEPLAARRIICHDEFARLRRREVARVGNRGARCAGVGGVDCRRD